MRVFSLQFSPTGQEWAAATTEGLLIYSLNTGLIFDPWDLQIDITPKSIKNAIQEDDYLNGNLLWLFLNNCCNKRFLLALTMALKLNEVNLIQEVIETVPVNDGKLIGLLVLI